MDSGGDEVPMVSEVISGCFWISGGSVRVMLRPHEGCSSVTSNDRELIVSCVMEGCI